MQLAAHELNELSELTMSCVNTITNMAYMLDHVQSQQFKSILEKHFPYHVRDYNMKVEFLKSQQGPNNELPIFCLEGQLSNYLQSRVNQYQPIQPRTQISELNDREMATAYLLTLKRAGREYAWATMEASNPRIRGFLETAFLMASSHAYEVYQYMVSMGYYPLEQANQMMTSKISNMYQVVPEEQERVNQYAQRYQSPIIGNSQFMYQNSNQDKYYNNNSNNYQNQFSY
ncbi:MAG: Coat domain protein [Bacillota bacterium]|jgi:spore coat protein CotF|nr:Coat domain protein [Bacillota bacterium]